MRCSAARGHLSCAPSTRAGGIAHAGRLWLVPMAGARERVATFIHSFIHSHRTAMFDSYNNATRGMSGPVRIQEQNRTECDAARDWPRRGAAPTRVATGAAKSILVYAFIAQLLVADVACSSPGEAHVTFDSLRRPVRRGRGFRRHGVAAAHLGRTTMRWRLRVLQPRACVVRLQQVHSASILPMPAALR